VGFRLYNNQLCGSKLFSCDDRDVVYLIFLLINCDDLLIGNIKVRTLDILKMVST